VLLCDLLECSSASCCSTSLHVAACAALLITP
jgi:hypothetical protein